MTRALGAGECCSYTGQATRPDLRPMPLLAGQSLDHWYRLGPDARMQVWRAGFGPDGDWSRELCECAIDRLPPDFFIRLPNAVPSPRQGLVFNNATMTAPAGANTGETPALMLVKRMRQHSKRVKTAAMRAGVERTAPGTGSRLASPDRTARLSRSRSGCCHRIDGGAIPRVFQEDRSSFRSTRK
jgi:hypothetical protein